jgi:hypothetical protein
MYISNTTHGLIDCGHLDFDNSKVAELHRCNLSDSDWNSWAGENVVRITRLAGLPRSLRLADSARLSRIL